MRAPLPFLACSLALAGVAHAATESVLYAFKGGGDGKEPIGGLMWAGNRLYGTTFAGGELGPHCPSIGCGTVYALKKDGALTKHDALKTVHQFAGGQDGANPWSGLIDVHGTFYGTTSGGGSSDWGTVYAVTPAGNESILHAFRNGNDGGEPLGGLLYSGGNFYGTTYAGGGHPCYDNEGCGTVFSLTPSAREKVLHAFKTYNDADEPFTALIRLGDRLYGTSYFGGTNSDNGTVFAVTLRGREEIVHAFAGGADGSHSEAGLIDVGGTLYGTAYRGGANDAGLVFALTPQGSEKPIYVFHGGSDGAEPLAPLISVGGTLYGTTYAGGASNMGTVFAITPDGSETVLHSFTGGSDGAAPVAGLLRAGGTLFGTTSAGGAANAGTVFCLPGSLR